PATWEPPPMRVYVPSTQSALRGALAAGELGPAPIVAYAVTPTLREWYTSGDEEELEYAAMTDAARASLRLIEATPDAASRRVVVAAEVPDGQAAPASDLERGAVRLAAGVPLAKVVAGHVDAPA